jgi:hypothetical protein
VLLDKGDKGRLVWVRDQAAAHKKEIHPMLVAQGQNLLAARNGEVVWI